MGSNTIRQFLSIALLFATIFLISDLDSLTTCAQGTEPGSSSTTVDDFCNQRATREDRGFCQSVFRSNPRSATAVDNVSLLMIAKDLAVGNARKSREFFNTLTKNNGTRPSLLPVLNECISVYDETIYELLLIAQDLVDDPPMAPYDAHMANQVLDRCQNSLKINDVLDDFILSRHKIATDYGRLVEEIAKSI